MNLWVPLAVMLAQEWGEESDDPMNWVFRTIGQFATAHNYDWLRSAIGVVAGLYWTARLLQPLVRDLIAAYRARKKVAAITAVDDEESRDLERGMIRYKDLFELQLERTITVFEASEHHAKIAAQALADEIQKHAYDLAQWQLERTALKREIGRLRTQLEDRGGSPA